MKGSFFLKSFFLLILGFGFITAGMAQKETKLLRQGNTLYKQGKYKDAEMSYRKALETNKGSVKGQFNLADAMYKQKNFDESSRIFGSLADSKLDKETKAHVLHNLGNSYLEAHQYDKSIYAYKQSLLNSPQDKDTKYNLEYAKAMLKKQQQQQQQNKNQQNKDQQKKDQQQKQDQQNSNKDQQKKNQPDQKKISKEDAERMLEALKNDEKKTLEKVKKQKASVQQANIEKDW
ncbi:MAG: tetratricopeptide repeat protein [Bacteroidota bacterium]|nr:tetratricopeptide repeat protein [Bacteroidota bacterium]